jgi:serine/threonine-protein kinase
MSDLPRPIDTAQLLKILDGVMAALEASHSAGNPHRDVKPPNVIEVEDEAGETRWVLADWGLTRRAPGATTARHTKTREFLGSEGFAPPEAYRNAHDVGIPGDIYALGQLIAWATGVDPVPNVSPTVQGAWQRVVELTTQQEPDRRLQSIAEVRELLAAIRTANAGEEAPDR